MTAAELHAYNAGVRAALATAKRTAEAIRRRGTRPLHDGFAAEALDAFAEAGIALALLSTPTDPASSPAKPG